MKAKLIIGNIIAIIIILLTSVTYAATGTAELKADVKELKKGETFTVTLVVASEEGINGISTKYTYDTDKLELVSESLVNTTNWSNLGTPPELTIICNSTSSIKSADIYTLKFKVKDNVTAGSVATVETTDILLDTDAQSDSEVTISAKKVEVNVIEDKNNNTDDPGTNNPSNPNNPNNSNNTNNSGTNTKKPDSTSSGSTLPQTGESNVIIYILIAISIIFSVISYKKYNEYKKIK